MKVAVLLSGGVDSSVALKLLKDNQRSLHAFYIKVWLQDELTFLGDCPWEEDLRYAQEVCEQLQVPLKVISLQQAYWEKVVQPSIAEIKKGFTPNPDFLCNSKIKFGKMLNLVKKDYSYVASGHYALIVHHKKDILLKESLDLVKDQTYFLAGLKKEQLRHCLFPLGGYTKKEVRAIAEQDQLTTFKRKDSQGVCFLGKIKFREFIKYHLGERKGEIVNWANQQVLGEHLGYWFYTIGQRQGLNLSNGPWYVVKKNCEKNIVYVDKFDQADYDSSENILKEFTTFVISELNYLAEIDQQQDIYVKIRHGEKKYLGTIDLLNSKQLKVTLSEGDSGLAIGQYAVIYQKGICKLSGKIIKTLN